VRRDLGFSEEATNAVSSDAADGYTYLSIHTHIYVDRDTRSISIDRYAPENDVRRDLDLSEEATDPVSSELANARARRRSTRSRSRSRARMAAAIEAERLNVSALGRAASSISSSGAA